MPQDPLALLCIEPRFPGKLGAVADWLVRKRGCHCSFYCASADLDSGGLRPRLASIGHGLDVIPFSVGGAAREPSVHWTRGLERGLCYAFGCFEVLEARRPRPVDLILGRSAFLGSTLFAPVHLPAAPVVQFFDYYFHAHAHDLTADWAAPSPPTPLPRSGGEGRQKSPSPPPLSPEAGARGERAAPPDYFYWRRAANAVELIDLENGVVPWTATRWQRDLFPSEYREDFVVLHPGVDVRRFTGRSRSERPTVAALALPPETRLVTFVARRLDRLRGFDRFTALADRLLRERSDVVCVAVGGGPVDRGLDVEFHGRDYATHVLGQTPPHDPERFRMLGAVAPNVLAEILAASDLHVYPSRPYAVSQSLVEAMAAGCVVLAWDEPPVREFIEPGRTGLLADGADPDGAARLALTALTDLAGHRPLGDAAAALVRERFADDVTLPALAALFDRLASSRR